ncbi:tetratricopeptide repeat protein [Leptospirillum ferriphilum]|uniref:Uncharacterized protein n=1 Tax=Leptospirillum ferriphilum YSK TaxID=1441628 RepID=A0A059XX98_9BACT|nr:tetratricopeptide repeat protein [Leptospirillum ferriphilum]AIA31735.1 hypothetical protein Y981_06785 [Leptospirillum ferriphilum YSK]
MTSKRPSWCFLLVLFFLFPALFSGCASSGPRLPKLQSDARSALSNANQQFLQQHPDTALHLVRQALRAHQLLGDLPDSVRDMDRIGYIEVATGQYSKAVVWYERADLLASILRDPLLKAQTDVLSCDTEIFLQQNDQARQTLKNVRAILAQLPDSAQKKHILAHALNSEGMLFLREKHFRKALSSFQKALSLNRKNGDSSITASNFSNIGIANLGLKQPKKSREAFEKALSIDRKSGNPEGIAFDSEGLSLADIQIGHWDQALQSILAAFQIRLQQHDMEQSRKDFALFQDVTSKHPVSVNTSLLQDWPVPSP